MMLALLLLAVMHPGIILVGPESNLPSRKERKLEKKAKKTGNKSLRSDTVMEVNEIGDVATSHHI